MKDEVVMLVKTLSAGEKRAFRMHSKRQSGDRAYLDLYDIINTTSSFDIKGIVDEFHQMHPTQSVESVGQYLMRVITDTLVQLKINQDNSYKSMYGIMRSMVLFERSLDLDGHKELNRVKMQSRQSQDHMVHYMASRLELNQLAKGSGIHTTENELISLQNNARNLLKVMRQIQEHHSLFEILTFRLKRSGRTLSDADYKKLDDLVLSELSLITRGVEKNFESQKMHLLFQSYYFTHTGDYKSALSVFGKLVSLFENNMQIWQRPPYDYLLTLEGVLQSMRTLRQYEEMSFYLLKIEKLATSKQTEHFISLCQQIILLNTLIRAIYKKKDEVTKDVVRKIEKYILNKKAIVDYERLSELQLYTGIAYLHFNNWKKASTFFDQVIYSPNMMAEIYKVSRLLNIIVHYELKNLSYLDHEIRAYKRRMKAKKPLLTSEKILLKTIQFDPRRKSRPQRQLFFKRIKNNLSEVENSRYDLQLLKYYDFTHWIKTELLQ